MKKRLISLLLVLSLVTAILAGCNTEKTPDPSSSDADPTSESSTPEPEVDEDPYTVKMVLLGAQEPADLAKIEEKINEILLPAINMQVDIDVIGFGAYGQQMPLMLSGGEKVDLVPVLTGYAGTFVSQKQVIDLKPLLEEYGQNIKTYIGEDKYTVANLNGYVYGVPTTGGWYTQTGICIREDWLTEAGFTVDDIKTMDDLEPVYTAVKAKHPEASMYITFPTIEDGRIETADSLSDFNGVLLDYGQDTKITNFYASDVYEKYVNRMYDWAQKGWISKDAATSTELPSALVKAGSAFSYPAPLGPGTAEQESVNTGMSIVTTPLNEAFITTAGMTFLSWSIAQNSEDPVKTMQFLNYLYEDADVLNLMNWGIEGEHYQANDDGTIGFAEGLNAETSGYFLNQGWLLPRQFITKVWEGNSPTVWDEMTALNDSALKSKALGFRFDSTPVDNQTAAITSVKSEYRAAMNSGSVDPKESLPKYLAALEEAGMSEVIAEKQAQYDTWLAAQ